MILVPHRCRRELARSRRCARPPRCSSASRMRVPASLVAADSGSARARSARVLPQRALMPRRRGMLPGWRLRVSLARPLMASGPPSREACSRRHACLSLRPPRGTLQGPACPRDILKSEDAMDALVISSYPSAVFDVRYNNSVLRLRSGLRSGISGHGPSGASASLTIAR